MMTIDDPRLSPEFRLLLGILASLENTLLRQIAHTKNCDYAALSEDEKRKVEREADGLIHSMRAGIRNDLRRNGQKVN